MSIPDSAIEEVRQRASIAEIVAEHVPLKRSGRSLTACCPFHSEKTPSFNINDEEGFFKCFGCGKKGDVFAFLMELRGWTFPETVEFLARRYGVTIPEQRGPAVREQSRQRDQNAQLRKIAAGVAAVYSDFLWKEASSAAARSYLERRGLSNDCARRFQLGYAPARLEPLVEQLSTRLEPEMTQEQILLGLEKLGILRRREADRSAPPYPFFRDRLIFPITRSDACPIAFGGRTLVSAEGVPKYINSPESAIYQKRKTLYGIAQASESLRRSRQVILVEGYTDVMALSQAGIAEVVATCGTALSEEHAQVLRRLVQRAVVVFDGDDAGRAAAARCFERFLNSSVELQVLFLPPGEDPDSFVRRQGRQALLDLIAREARSGLQAFIEHERGAQGGIVATAKVAEAVVRLIQRVINPVEQELLIRETASVLGVDAASLERLRDSGGQGSRGRSGAVAASPRNTRAGAEPSRPARTLPPRGPEKAVEPLIRLRKATLGSPLGAYIEQLVVAVICEPEIADAVAEMPSLLDPAVLNAERAAQVARLLSAVREAEAPQGLRAASQTGTAEEVLQEWESLLHGCGIESAEGAAVLAEALRQARIGGIRNDELLSSASLVSQRANMLEALRRLREAETQAASEQDKISLAQEKLKARREMDRLRAKELK